jgi:hypothetical protein
MGTQATSVNVKNPQTSNHSKSTLIPLFQKLVVMLIDRVACHIWPRPARVNWSRYLSQLAQACPSDVIELAY